ncbi:MAG: thioredoxin domain-containing protein [Xanthomonadaceae bacterium]|nr:thioredoxin domain-containing protein [Xanthomonadaceae bacterium]
MPNRLADASSPYLLQHADNPVDWHEWDSDALALARAEDKPILLSIGYAACHWCHVMSHESFEDTDTAALMNQLFVNIKLDREQRPDLDRIYQLAHQLIQRRGGGWPLTAFLDPHTHHPFFVGTYFPRDSRHGLPAFRDVLQRVADWYRKEPEARAQNNRALSEFFGAPPPAERGTTTGDGSGPGHRAQAALEHDFDARHGGFSSAPKFPHTTQLEWLIRRDDARAQHMARFSLGRMCRSGLFDQLGGGFYRYSVDARWEIPHFEKMLYDNGTLLAALAVAHDGDPVFAHAARLTAEWTIREMQHPAGGYFASLDADSEGEEGRFYTWDAAEVRAALQPDEWQAFAPAYGLDGPSNFESRWHLHHAGDADLAQAALTVPATRLHALRAARVRPALDDKVLAGWNGLMIRGMAMAGRAWHEPAWTASALAAARFVRRELWRDGRLVTSWHHGRALPVAFLDDYAYLLDALLELLQLEFDADLLAFATDLADDLLDRFADQERGGFWFTPDDHERLIQRPKSFTDDATPNGNGVAAHALNRLGRLVGDTRYTDAARTTIGAAVAGIGDWPHAHAAVLLALSEHETPPELAIMRGPRDALATLGAPVDPPALEFRIPTELESLPGQLAHQPALDGKPTLYRCVGHHCEAPRVLDS